MIRFLLPFLLFNFMTATPRIALENGTTCATCHINPTGGALRNLHGIEIVSLDELPGRVSDGFYPENYTGILNEFLRVGGDFRVQAFSRKSTDGRKNRLIPMQAEIYGWFSASRQLGLYVEADLNPNGTGQEYWLLFRDIFGKNWLKIGKAIPNYGLRLDNHTSFIRGGSVRQNYGLDSNQLPFSPLYTKPVMIESGLPLASNILITLSAGESLYPGSRFDTAFKTFSGMFQIYGQNAIARYLLALQIMRLDQKQMGGISAGFGHPRLTVLTEMDLIHHENDIRALVLYEDISWTVIPGLHLTGTYEFVDPDLALKSGSLSRYVVGVDYFPIPLVEVLFQARFHQIETISTTSAGPELFLQLHTWF